MTKITLAALSLFLLSCGNTASENAKVETPKSDTSVVAKAETEHEHDENEAIELDNGKKWKVDTNMMTHFQAMKIDIAAFKGKTTSEYEALAVNLKKNIDRLTSNCTMTGQAHDEVHKWLLPYIDLVDEFSESKSEAEFEKHYQELKSAYVTFDTYFE